jgi:predicted nucleic acid-binding protein
MPSVYKFVSADKRLIDVAQKEGLETINPNEIHD